MKSVLNKLLRGAFPFSVLFIAACGGGGGGGGTSPAPTTPTQSEAILYNFGAPNSGDANKPSSDLVMDSNGNLYGTTIAGGANNTGAVFKITPSGTETILHNFGPIGTTSDGTGPSTSSLVLDGSGNLYGTTQNGGLYGGGTVFKITPSGTETILYNFPGTSFPGSDFPVGHLAIDGSGNLYGTTQMGGSTGKGTVFEITPSGTETILYNFSGPVPGGGLGAPTIGLVMDSSGNLYGAANEAGFASGYGLCGTTSTPTVVVFKLTPSGNISTGSCTYSLSELMIDSSGNLYGTTPNSNGEIYKITPSLVAYSIYSFSGDKNSSGTINHSDLLMDGSGNLYGTTSNDGANGVGSVFKLTPAGAETTVYSFKNSGDGAFPMAGLVMDSSGNLYGTTSLGGTNGGGTVFKITKQ
ncbi:MAG: choice-of-anchor tandem repeat GloVer-containing protein [Acidiferrobacterales bacterium]